jgi:hypothetical protein
VKLVVPVAAMMVGTAFCCCCGGGGGDEVTVNVDEGAMDRLIQEVTSRMGSGDRPVSEDGAGDEAQASKVPGGAGIAGGTCGLFRSGGFSAPAGFKVKLCTEAAENDTLILEGSGAPADACAVGKAWAKDQGYSIVAESDSSGTIGIYATKGDHSLSIGCNTVMGQTLLTLSAMH